MATVIDISGAAPADRPTPRYVDLSDIVGGAIIATAVSAVLLSFGSAFGLSFASAEPGEGISLRWLAIAGGIWLIWTSVSATAAGAYFAGRMRRPAGDTDPDEMETRDGAHGIAVWALAALMTLLLAAVGVGGTARVVGETVGGAAGGVAEAISQNSQYLAGVALRNGNALPSTEARAEVSRVLVRSLTEGEVTEPDRQYLAQVVAAESRLTPAEARARIDGVIGQAEQARDEAIELAEQARIFSLIGAFIVAASLLASAAAAWFAAVLGGQHRNEKVGFAHFATRRRVR